MKNLIGIMIVCSLLAFCTPSFATELYDAKSVEKKELIQQIDITFETALESLKAQWAELREKVSADPEEAKTIIYERQVVVNTTFDKGFD